MAMVDQTGKPVRSRATPKASGDKCVKHVEVRTFCLSDDTQATLIPAGWVPFAAQGPIIYAYKA